MKRFTNPHILFPVMSIPPPTNWPKDLAKICCSDPSVGGIQ